MSLYSFVVCKPSGEPIGEPVSVGPRTLSRQLNGATSASIVTRTDDPVASYLVPSAGPPRLKVWRAPSARQLAANPGATPELVFYGASYPEHVRVDPARDTIEVVFLDPRALLAYRYTVGGDTFSAIDQGLIAWTLLDAQNARSDTWVLQGTTTTGVLRTVDYERGVLTEAWNRLTDALDGGDIDIVPFDGYAVNGSRSMGHMHMYARQGTDRSASVAFAYSQNDVTNCENITVTWRPVTTYVTVTGSSRESAGVVTATAGDYQSSAWGLLEESVSYPDIAEQAIAAAMAQGVVTERQEPRPLLEVIDPTTEAPVALEDYFTGDLVRVIARKGALDINVVARVHAIEITLDANGRERVKLATVLEV